jgi:hypothetical protein
MGRASELPVIAVRNPKDNVLRYAYATVGGERSAAFGASGAPSRCENVVECVTPTNLTREAKIDEAWAKVGVLRNIANHHEKFYLEYVRRIVSGEVRVENPPDRRP